MTQAEAAPQQDPTQKVDPSDVEANVAGHHDPLHDIDVKTTSLAVAGSLAVIVFSIWGMTHVYNLLVVGERLGKIQKVATEEIDTIRAAETEELEGRMPGRGEKTLEEALEFYLANPTWRPHK